MKLQFMYILFVVTVEERLVGGIVGSPNCSKQKLRVGVWADRRRWNIFMDTYVATWQGYVLLCFIFTYLYPSPLPFIKEWSRVMSSSWWLGAFLRTFESFDRFHVTLLLSYVGAGHPDVVLPNFLSCVIRTGLTHELMRWSNADTS